MVGTGTISNDLKRWYYRVRGKEDPFLKIGETNDRSISGDSEYVWALKDINLEVKPGEVLGIIGKNGAGKSTLLKILSKVTGPTTGRILFNGRIGSLLEVGTGFHPELTGRENIFLNGAILGMTKTEIRDKLDEIIDFSGCERYIDTPVKRYSSGMMVRLGFAVAAHLEPEILVVDEVLAVGDAEFQKKAVGKMQDVSRNQGRTVLFVSHNMASVKSLCNNGMILKNGIIRFKGDIDAAVTNYLSDGHNVSFHKKRIYDDSFENENIIIHEIGINAINKRIGEILRIDDECEIFIIYELKREFQTIHTTLHVKDEIGTKIFSTGSDQQAINDKCKIKAKYLSKIRFPANFFNWGTFYIDLYIVKDRKQVIYLQNDILNFTITNKELPIGAWMGKEPGAIHPVFEWKLEKLS